MPARSTRWRARAAHVATVSVLLLSWLAHATWPVRPTLGVFVWLAPALLAMRWLLYLDGPARRRELRRMLGLGVLLAVGLSLPIALVMDVRWRTVPIAVGIQLATLYPLVALDGALAARAPRAPRAERWILHGARLLAVAFWLPVTMLSLATHRVHAAVPHTTGGGERIHVRAADGVGLEGLWLPHHDPRGAVLLVHGLGAEKVQFLEACAVLRQAGFEVLTYDQRNHGESGGATCTLGHAEADDCVRAWRVLRERARTGPLLLYGISFGGAAAQLAATRLPGLAGLVLDSTFADLRRVAATRIPVAGDAAVRLLRLLALDVAVTGVPALDVVPVAAVRPDDSFPVLVLHARADPLVPFAEAEALAAAYGPRARLVALAGTGHAQGFWQAPVQHADALRAFVARVPR